MPLRSASRAGWASRCSAGHAPGGSGPCPSVFRPHTLPAAAWRRAPSQYSSSSDAIDMGRSECRHFSTSRDVHARHADHYGSLRLHRTATKQQIKARFYELSKKTHPDAPGGSTEKFHEINEAYSILGDESKRREYDRSMQPASMTTSTSSSSSSSSSFGRQPHHRQQHTTYDYHNRKSGPHAGWSTRRPPPRGPPPFTGGTYSPFGRHTPSGYAGASSGTYGDPWAQAREQWRAEFSNVRMGRSSFDSSSDSSGSSGSSSSAHGGSVGGSGHGRSGTRSHRGPKAPLRRDDHNSGYVFQIFAVCTLVMLGLACGGGITAKADEGGGEGTTSTDY